MVLGPQAGLPARRGHRHMTRCEASRSRRRKCYSVSSKLCYDCVSRVRSMASKIILVRSESDRFRQKRRPCAEVSVVSPNRLSKKFHGTRSETSQLRQLDCPHEILPYLTVIRPFRHSWFGPDYLSDSETVHAKSNAISYPFTSLSLGVR